MAEGKDVVFDTTFFDTNEKYTKRPFLLDKFALIDHIKTVKHRPKQNIFVRILNKLDVDRRVRYVAAHIRSKNMLADGYYTSEKYFSHSRNILLDEIRIKDESDLYKTWKEKIAKANKPLMIHARRTDYVGSGFVNLGEDYYKEALSHFDDDCDIFAFSDDIEWLSGIIKRPVTPVSGQGLKDYEELMLMTLGENFIIANSTFSWWGAWLSQAKDKKVVAPKKYMTSSLYFRANRDFIPETWVRI